MRRFSMSDLKLFEDLIALAQTGSFVRAAELRHVTHPAFGRRIRALETWAGAPLVERGRTPVVLTAQGEALLQAAGQVVEQVDRVREQLRSAGRQEERILRIGTGRSLARTLVADWIARLRQRPARLLDGAQVELSTGVMQEMAALLEQGRVDLVCCYEHPALSVQLTPGRFRYMTLGIDKLVPVCQADARGRPRHALSEGGPAAPLITYSGGLAMARIAGDRLETFPYALAPFVRCDSLDAAHGMAQKGLGIAWLPWSMVAGDCRRGVLAALGGRAEEIAFEVRLYRPRTRLSALAEAVWECTQRGR
ncbi:LysR substrate-binding domain protein [Bordetella pertussis I036]|nr:LysR substrate-binding domain protein [Bordetella pertussis CHLA-11]ETH01115.1 LysR substrate-binding domain protein [Bordetella pertussis 2250905]ETH05911.1 LysR substrate-binding domain protein [Bordetella pertussis 2356847]ETH07496.1 LysR substrate-binding domain protein [Bordetella pertussis 2371640]ETH23584.1 LysR substrate-binding domain protein [Bordetella pertussis CHLA-15]ETH28875.1 LysR substrate-binding domain protein [Bordetella pertussis CHLA-20]ETH32949.1 LysR substrate-bindi